jgi:hypothetical protein
MSGKPHHLMCALRLTDHLTSLAVDPERSCVSNGTADECRRTGACLSGSASHPRPPGERRAYDVLIPLPQAKFRDGDSVSFKPSRLLHQRWREWAWSSIHHMRIRSDRRHCTKEKIPTSSFTPRRLLGWSYRVCCCHIDHIAAPVEGIIMPISGRIPWGPSYPISIKQGHSLQDGRSLP